MKSNHAAVAAAAAAADGNTKLNKFVPILFLLKHFSHVRANIDQ